MRSVSRGTTTQVIKNHTYQGCQNLRAYNRAHLIAVTFQAGIIKLAYDDLFPSLRCACFRSRFSFPPKDG